MKRNFLPLRTFRDLADLNAQARAWVMTEAGERIHGTTRVAPLTLFALERPTLLPLPGAAPDLGTWHRVTVHRDCHVQFERALYSVPFTLAGKVLWLRATDVAVSVFEDYRHVTTHLRARRAGERCTVRDHLPPAAQAFFAHDRAWCLTQAECIGPDCATLVGRLLGDRLVERYGATRCEAACTRALAHDSPHYRTVKTILAGGHDREPLVTHAQAAVYVARPRFARDAHELFHPCPQPDELH